MDNAERILERRLMRLREELSDERIVLPLDGAAGLRLLAELFYARRPVHHEGRVPRYGALVFAGVPDWDRSPQTPLLVPGETVEPAVLRRYADGRSSFVVVGHDGMAGLAIFEHSLEDELSAVRLQRAGAVVVQRSDRAGVRVCAPDGVVLWTGSRWVFKPVAGDYVRIVARLVPHADPAVLTGLLELAVHSLAAARVGATFVWNLDGRPCDDRRGGLVELGRAMTGPPVSVARRGHFPAILSVEAQVDLATIVASDGSVGPIGARLDHSARAGSLVPPVGGARHTSARRFSFDVPGVLVVVVSESGRVTVFSGGAVAAEIRPDQDEVGAPTGRDRRMAGDTVRRRCTRCEQPLLVLLNEDGARVGEQDVSCPVCGSPVPGIGGGSVILGVPVEAPRGAGPVADA